MSGNQVELAGTTWYSFHTSLPLSRSLLYFAFLHRLIEDASKLFPSPQYSILSVRNYAGIEAIYPCSRMRRVFAIGNDVSRWRRTKNRNTPSLCFDSPQLTFSLPSSWIPSTHFPQNHDFNLFKGFSRRARTSSPDQKIRFIVHSARVQKCVVLESRRSSLFRRISRC